MNWMRLAGMRNLKPGEKEEEKKKKKAKKKSNKEKEKEKKGDEKGAVGKKKSDKALKDKQALEEEEKGVCQLS